MRVPLVDLAAQHAALGPAVAEAVQRVIGSQRFILGPEVEAFERALATYVGAEHAIGVSSGTDALLVSLMALGIGAGDEVITTPFTFFATAGSIARLGATPRFADISSDSFNLDPELLAAAISPNTRAIVAVHLFGIPAQPDRLSQIASEHGLPLVEDAAQALGASHGGRKAGTWGTLACFSFFPSKPLGALGDGGMIVTSDEALAQRCRLLRVHGAESKHEDHPLIGGNFRLDALQAAVLSVKLPRLDGWLKARRKHADAYDAALGNLSGLGLPARSAGSVSAWSHYTVRVADGCRDALAAHLKKRGVACAVYYPKPLHLQPCFAHLGLVPGAFPESERASREALSLPIYPELSVEQRDYVVLAVREFFG